MAQARCCCGRRSGRRGYFRWKLRLLRRELPRRRIEASVGLGLAASGVLQPSRRYMLVAAAPLVIGGILTQFVSTRDAAISVVGVSAAVSCLLNAVGLARLVRRERYKHAGN